MFQAIRNWLYELIVSTGILLPFRPFIFHIILMIKDRIIKPWNYVITDEGGATMRTTKHNGKLFPSAVSNLTGIKKLRIRHDDVMLCGYPKTGCHWVHEIIHMLVKRKAELSKHGKVIEGMIDLLPQIVVDSAPSPRVLNSHFWYEDLPEQMTARKTKIVLTVRSPKDTVVSYYNHIQALKFGYRYHGTFENFFKLFMSGEIEYGSYLDHILDWEKVIKTQKDNPILVVEFEELKRDTVGTVKEIARFLDIDVTDKFVDEIVETSRFGNMQAKFPKNKLLRKGQVGDWQKWLTETQSQQIEKVWQDKMSHCAYQPKF